MMHAAVMIFVWRRRRCNGNSTEEFCAQHPTPMKRRRTPLRIFFHDGYFGNRPTHHYTVATTGVSFVPTPVPNKSAPIRRLGHQTLSRYGIYLLGISTNWRPSITLHSELKVHSEQLIQRTNAGRLNIAIQQTIIRSEPRSSLIYRSLAFHWKALPKQPAFFTFSVVFQYMNNLPLLRLTFTGAGTSPPTRNDQSTDRPRGLRPKSKIRDSSKVSRVLFRAACGDSHGRRFRNSRLNQETAARSATIHFYCWFPVLCWE